MNSIDRLVLYRIRCYICKYGKCPAQIEVAPDLLQFMTRREYTFHVYNQEPMQYFFFVRRASKSKVAQDNEYKVVTVPVVPLPEEVYEPCVRNV